MRRAALLLGAAVAIGGGAACAREPTPPRDDTVPGFHAEARVTASQGGRLQVTIDNDPLLAGTSVRIPAGALAADTTITIDLSSPDIVIAGAAPAGPVVGLGPPGTTFSAAVRVTVPCRRDGSVRAHRRETPGQREIIGPDKVALDSGLGLVSFDVLGFSDFQAQVLDCQPSDEACPCQSGVDCPVETVCDADICRRLRCDEIDCDDHSTCTNDSCENGRCQYAAVAPGTPCDDGDSMTVDDSCERGVCVGTPVGTECDDAPACDDGDPCTEEACEIGFCVLRAGVDGTACDDGDPDTTSDRCVDGVCVGDPIDAACTRDADCDDGNVCTVNTCVDYVCARANATNGKICNDGNPDTTGDRCRSGTCAGTPLHPECSNNADCDDGNACTTDRCTYQLCSHTRANDGTSCDDGNPDTTGDACVSGTCVGTTG